MIAVWITVLSLPLLANSAPTERQALLFLTAWGYEVNRPEGPHTSVTKKMKMSDDKRGPHITFTQVKEIVPSVCDWVRLAAPEEPGPRVNVSSVLVACEWLEKSAVNFLTGYGIAANSGTVIAVPTPQAKYGGNTTYTQVDALLPWVCGKAVDNGYRRLSQYNLVTLRFGCDFLASKMSGNLEFPLNLKEKYTPIVVRFLKGIANIIYISGDEAHVSLRGFIYNNGMITPNQAKPYVEEIMDTITNRDRHHAVSTHDAGLIMAACRYLKEHIYGQQE